MRMSRSAGAVSIDCQCLFRCSSVTLSGVSRGETRQPEKWRSRGPARPIVRNRGSVVTLVPRGTAPPASVCMPAAFVPFRHMAPAYDAGRKRRIFTMGLFSTPIKTLDDLFVHTLQDIYYVEKQILKNLPTMAEKATDPQLKQAFQTHLNET